MASVTGYRKKRLCRVARCTQHLVNEEYLKFRYDRSSARCHFDFSVRIHKIIIRRLFNHVEHLMVHMVEILFYFLFIVKLERYL